MTTKDIIKTTINMGQEVLMAYIGDLEDADLLVCCVPGVNNVAWQLGHLIAGEHKMMIDCGFTMPPLPDGFEDAYGEEGATCSDTTKFFNKDEYIEAMNQQRAGTMAALEAISEADLDKATPENMKDYAPTIGSALNIVGLHLMMHAGQFVPLRRKLGKPVTI